MLSKEAVSQNLPQLAKGVTLATALFFMGAESAGAQTVRPLGPNDMNFPPNPPTVSQNNTSRSSGHFERRRATLSTCQSRTDSHLTIIFNTDDPEFAIGNGAYQRECAGIPVQLEPLPERNPYIELPSQDTAVAGEPESAHQ